MNLKPETNRSCIAFTLVELLVVVMVCLGIILVLVPVLAHTAPNGAAAQCVENLRRLSQAWEMYSADNRGSLVPNLQGGSAQGGNFPPATGPAWAAGWLDWSTSPDNTNVLFLLNERYARLARYVGPGSGIFKCPLDISLSSAQQARGWTQRSRSYSLSVGLGIGNAEQGAWSTIYRHITTSSDLVYPRPGETFVFIDEDSQSINDPAFFSPQQASLVDYPTVRHAGAAAVSFADGHAVVHKWAGSVSYRPVPPGAVDPDLHWLSFHTQRLSESSY